MTQDITLLTVPPFSSLCNLAFALRREVFILEQNVPPAEEFDDLDLSATHVVALYQGEIVGTLRLIYTDEHVKIGRVALRATMRGRGFAKAMMLFAMSIARDQGRDKFYLAAQLDKLGFYEKLGFVAYGDVFDDAGIPHRDMRNY